MYFRKTDDNGTMIYTPFLPKIKEIRRYLNRIGTLDATDMELYEAWSTFSQEQYDASFLIVEKEFLDNFADWLNDREGNICLV